MLIPKQTIIRAPRHLARLTTCPCSVPGCFRTPIHAHHDRLGTGGGMGMKPSDLNCVPFCYHHHAEGHQRGWRWFQAHYDLNLRAIAAWHAFHSRLLGLLPESRHA